jgi:hypothetical protein
MIEQEFAYTKPFPDFTWVGLARRLRAIERLIGVRR